MDADRFLEHFLPGDSEAVVSLRHTIAQLNLRYKNRRMGRSVLLLGETGVGKNHLARVIAGHLMWLRDPQCWSSPGSGNRSKSIVELVAERFAEVSIPNVPDNLVESDLFGHVKGAFTGATSDRDGYFGDEQITDLLLDEIGEATPALQAKLLQVLNDGGYRRVGDDPSDYRRTEARIFLATNRNLGEMVREERFRKDLYWRINNIVIHQPPLRDQAARIPALAESIAARIQIGNNVAPEEMLRLSATDLAWAKGQSWPGNVRELERLIWLWLYEEGAVALAEVRKRYPLEAPNAHASTVKAIIRSRVTQALAEGRPLADSVGDFCDLSREAQQALCDVTDELGLDRQSLETLFGDGAKAAKQISAWRGKLRS